MTFANAARRLKHFATLSIPLPSPIFRTLPTFWKLNTHFCHLFELQKDFQKCVTRSASSRPKIGCLRGLKKRPNGNWGQIDLFLIRPKESSSSDGARRWRVCAHSPSSESWTEQAWKAIYFPRWIMCEARQTLNSLIATHIINAFFIFYNKLALMVWAEHYSRSAAVWIKTWRTHL